jgi:hypothetical protein
MLKLTVASLGTHVPPPVLFQRFDEIANLHAASSLPAPPNVAMSGRAAVGEGAHAAHAQRVRSHRRL